MSISIVAHWSSKGPLRLKRDRCGSKERIQKLKFFQRTQFWGSRAGITKRSPNSSHDWCKKKKEETCAPLWKREIHLSSLESVHCATLKIGLTGAQRISLMLKRAHWGSRKLIMVKKANWKSSSSN